MSVISRRSAAERARYQTIGEALARAVERTHFSNILAARGSNDANATSTQTRE